MTTSNERRDDAIFTCSIAAAVAMLLYIHRDRSMAEALSFAVAPLSAHFAYGIIRWRRRTRVERCVLGAVGVIIGLQVARHSSEGWNAAWDATLNPLIAIYVLNVLQISARVALK